VNYEVVGANRWKHAPSIAAMSNGVLRLHLSTERAGAGYRLTAERPSGEGSVMLTVDLAGLFAGHVDFIANKKDFDFGISLYELRADGTYMQLPPYQARASHVGSPTRRRLLVPGARQRLDFRSIRLASHQCQAGSRLVVVLGILKSPGQQINYGTGKDVSDETIADAEEPLTIRWFDDSAIEVPVWRPVGRQT
jgi:hypothetical protein